MPNGAEITLVGNLTRDPELRFTNTNKAICHLGMAVNRRVGGDKPDVTSFFDVVAWEKLGEHAAESLTKGDRVVVVGRMEQRSWEKEDGGKGSRWEVTADAIGPDLRFKSLEKNAVRTAGREQREAVGGYGASEDPF